MTESHCKILGRPQATWSASARATMVSSKSLTPHLEGGMLGEVSQGSCIFNMHSLQYDRYLPWKCSLLSTCIQLSSRILNKTRFCPHGSAF